LTVVCTSKDRSSQFLEAILQDQGTICCYQQNKLGCYYWKDNAPVIQMGHRVALQIRWS
jgi:hypothetical protein